MGKNNVKHEQKSIEIFKNIINPLKFRSMYSIYRECCATPSVWGHDQDLQSVHEARLNNWGNNRQTESCINIKKVYF